MSNSLSRNAKVGLTAMSVVAVLAVGVYVVGENSPVSNGESAGTIAPVERYRENQVTDADVSTGDQSVSLLMQTDAYELMINDPSFRALASDANFAALAQNP